MSQKKISQLDRQVSCSAQVLFQLLDTFLFYYSMLASLTVSALAMQILPLLQLSIFSIIIKRGNCCKLCLSPRRKGGQNECI